MHEALWRRHPDLWASGQWTLLHDNARPHAALNINRFLAKYYVTVLQHPLYSPDPSPFEFFCLHNWKSVKRMVTWEYEGYSGGCNNGAGSHSKRGIHQLLPGLVETLATVHWLHRGLFWRGWEPLVNRMNFVFFTDPVSELYGQRLY